MTTKRINKTKDEVAKEMAHKEMIKAQKALAKRIYATIEKQDTIYDAQTVVNAVAGYIKYELSVKEAGIKLKDLIIDLKNAPKSKISKAMEELVKELQLENAKDTAMLLERFGQTLGHFSSHEFMKNKMSKIKIEDLIN